MRKAVAHSAARSTRRTAPVVAVSRRLASTPPAPVSRAAIVTAILRRPPASALHVRQLLGDEAVADPEDVDAADVPSVGGALVPLERPADHRPVARGERLLGLEPGARRGVEAAPPATGPRGRS